MPKTRNRQHAFHAPGGAVLSRGDGEGQALALGSLAERPQKAFARLGGLALVQIVLDERADGDLQRRESAHDRECWLFFRGLAQPLGPAVVARDGVGRGDLDG